MGLTAFEHVQTEQSALEPSADDFDGEVVPFGIYHLDANFVMGVRPLAPQLNVIQGGSGSRKTTLMLNIILNMCLSGKLPVGHKIVFDSLENGQSQEQLALRCRCILATNYLIYSRHAAWRDIEAGEDAASYLRQLLARPLPESDPVFLIRSVTTRYNGADIPALVFKPDFIEAWYRNRVYLSPEQVKAWLIAGDALQTFPIEFFGVSEHPSPDVAARRSTSTTDIEQSFERWCKLSEECGSVQIIADYLQEYWLTGTYDHYQKQLIVTPWLSKFIKEKRKTLWVISQEGIQHQRDFQKSGVVLGSSGGDVLKSASQNNWRVSYDADHPFQMVLHRPVKSRRGNHPNLRLMIEPNSGAIFGRSEIQSS